MKLLLELCYDGSAYHGYQLQKNAHTVADEINRAANKIFGVCDVCAVSRTDTGVHANNFYVAVSKNERIEKIPQKSIPVAMNTVLPDDIAVKRAFVVDDSFHPRYSALCKEYKYVILNSEIRNPFWHNRAYVYRHRLDEKYLCECANEFVGKYDFSGFMSTGSSVCETVRTIKYFRVERKGDFVEFYVCADGFLYNMVRILVGTLLECAEGKIKREEIHDIIMSKDRQRAGRTAPAYGLYLNYVCYKGITD